MLVCVDVLVCVPMFKCICMSWACVYNCMDIYMAVHGHGLEYSSAYVCVHRHTNGCVLVYAVFMGVSRNELLDQIRWRSTFQLLF